jgi:hypothetical protein
MCCGGSLTEQMPAAVRQMLAAYRRLRSESVWDWGVDWRVDPLGTWETLPCRLPVPLSREIVGSPELTAVAEGAINEHEALRCLSSRLTPSPGSSFVLLRPGQLPAIRTGEAARCLRGALATHWLIVDSRLDIPVDIGANGCTATLDPHAVAVIPIEVEADATGLTLGIEGTLHSIPSVVERTEAATLLLHSGEPVRWSVTDDRDGGWFPEGALPKWDSRFRPYFYGKDIELAVPAAPLTVTVARGVEYDPATLSVHPRPGSREQIHLSPRPRLDARARGWYSADLHVHAHYSGDLVVTPDDLALMQVGEGLNVMSVLAANLNTTRVYDQEAFEALVGQDLPWTDGNTLARYGIEYRNDLLGHFHAFAPSAPPARYQTGHVPAQGQEDWPPNAVACAEQRELGATVGYAHPVWRPFSPDGSPDSVFEPGVMGVRSVEARELVVDAALGLVDSIDLLGYNDWEASTQLYHHLLGCGIRLAVSVGTDVFLSISHGLHSDPPGWARMYAQLGVEPLTADAYKRAIRAGRTMATNGPWVTLVVAGQGPGAILDARMGRILEIEAECSGPGVTEVRIIGPGGAIARAPAAGEEAAVRATVRVDQPLWLAAHAIGVEHPSILRGPAFAHTSPVYVDLDGQRVARAADARWCLDWLDRFERLLDAHSRYRFAEHRRDLVDTIHQAREVYRNVLRAATHP